MKVVTWRSPNGFQLAVCKDCERKVQNWPRDPKGAEYCQVARGLHEGRCNLCKSDREE